MSKTPIVRPVSFVGVTVNIAIMVGFVGIGFFLGDVWGALIGVTIYFLLSVALRRTIGAKHQRGIRCCMKQQFDRAIPEFEKSLEFFDQRSWVDDYRMITMLSAAAMSYREMALVSLGFCYGQLGDGVNSRRMYEECLQRFPESMMAKTALNLMNAVASSPIETKQE